jgi:branched-chain amino acid transport system ATP-binding protein
LRKRLMRGMLEVHDLSKWFGGNAVLQRIAFRIDPGEVVGLIGPNGSGKTTLFNVITGFYRSRTGYIRLEGRDIGRLKPEDICILGLCRTFQITKPFINIPVIQNVMIGALSREKSLRKAEKKAEEVLDFVGMLKKKDVLGKNLTVSDRKRLEIARALATSPRLLLLDEVMAGLNANELKEMMQIIRNIRDAGTTLFIIEHIMTAMMELSQRIVVLDHGEIIAQGKPAEISCDPNCIKAYLGEEYLLAKD